MWEGTTVWDVVWEGDRGVGCSLGDHSMGCSVGRRPRDGSLEGGGSLQTWRVVV